MDRASVMRLGLLAGIWGASFLLIKLALEGLSPMQVVAGRLVTAALTLTAVAAARRQPLPRGRAVWGHLAVMSLVANVVPFFLISWGETRIDSGMAGVLNGTTPLFTLAVALALLPEERLSAARVGGLVLGFAGVLLIVAPDLGQGGPSAQPLGPLPGRLAGQLAGLSAAACYGVAFVYTRRYLAGRGLSPLALSTSQIGLAALVTLAAAPVWAGGAGGLTAGVVGSIVILGPLGTGLAYLLYFRLIADAGATSASTVTYLVPVVAVTLGVIALGEPLTWNLFAGAAVVILGVALAEGRIRRPRLRRRSAGGTRTPNRPPGSPEAACRGVTRRSS